MAAINFPNSPTQGDTFTANDKTWVYLDGKWAFQTGETPLPVSVASPTSGQFLKWNGTAWVNDTIDLGADTAGSFVASLVAGTGVTLANNSGEASTPTVTVDTTVIAPLASPTFTGTVSGVTKTMVGLSNVDNTTDANKPVSTAQQTALDLKAPIASPTFTGTVTVPTPIGNTDASTKAYVDSTASTTASNASTALTNHDADTTNIHGIVDTSILVTTTGTQTLTNKTITSPAGLAKGDVGLGNVDNTSDANKPVSTAGQTALDLKSNLASPTFTGTVTANDLTVSGNLTVSGTTTSYGTSFSSLGLQIGKVTRPTPFYHTGFIDDFRITKDICRYTSSFSPGSIPNPNDISISSINKLISSSTTAQISGLSDYSPYLIQVSATNALGDGSLSQEIAVGPIFSVPDAPTSLSVSWTGTYQLVSWIAPSNNGGSPIIRYELQRDIINTFSNPIAYAYTTDIASYIGNIYTSISKNTYYYRIRAINIAGNSSYSSTYSLSTSSPSAPPSAPVTTSLNSSVLLTWKPSISDNGDRIISYQIEHSASSSFTSSLMVSAGNTTSATITGLTNGSIRYFRVRAVNNMGLGAFSNYSSSTPLAPLSVPGAPTNFSSSWTTRTADTYPSISALSTWTDPISNGGSPIQSFIIETATNTEFTQNVSSPPIDTLSYLQTISHPITPTGNSVYYIRARAKNLVGTGPNSSTYALSGLIPSTMLAPIASPGNGLVSLSWSPPSKNGSIISSYIIDRSTTTNFASVTSNTVTNTSPGVNNVSITGLTNGSTYYFKIKAINITGTGIASAYSSALPSAPTAVPGIPLSFIMSRTSSTAASIKYTPPINNGGSAITGYSFQYSTNSGLSSPTTLSLSGTPIITNISGLSNVVYYNRISAMNSIGSSSYSSIQSTPIFLTNPGIPTNVTLANTTFWKPPYAIGYGERAISISWTAPVNFGGLSPVYYTPYLSTDNVNWADGCYFTGVSNMLRSPANTSPTCGAISATSGLFYGPRIKANTTYYLKVKAQNSIQSSGILFSSTSATKSITTGA